MLLNTLSFQSGIASRQLCLMQEVQSCLDHAQQVFESQLQQKGTCGLVFWPQERSLPLLPPRLASEPMAGPLSVSWGACWLCRAASLALTTCSLALFSARLAREAKPLIL